MDAKNLILEWNYWVTIYAHISIEFYLAQTTICGFVSLKQWITKRYFSSRYSSLTNVSDCCSHLKLGIAHGPFYATSGVKVTANFSCRWVADEGFWAKTVFTVTVMLHQVDLWISLHSNKPIAIWCHTGSYLATCTSRCLPCTEMLWSYVEKNYST